MAVKIRLARFGAKKKPYYKIVVANASAPRDGRFIEQIGVYDPMLAKENDNRYKVNAERAQYWLGVGAVPTERVKFIFKKVGFAS